jgi:beta-phosphoglucomutase-like phosphatase (HAD superfamily)
MFGVAIKPGLVEMLDLLELHRVPKAVATQTGSQSAAHRLAIVGVGQRFQALGKPAPDLYLEASRRLDIPPGRCIALEDSEPGIQSAYAAGMIPILIPDMKQPSAEVRLLAHRIFKSLNEAHSFFADVLESITTQKTLDFQRDL